jgi:CheY-like chemotaxis protein
MADEQPRLDGLRVLVVEDVAVLAWQVCDVLANAGAAVADPVSGVARALALLAEQKVDAAVLDKNLGGESSDTIADVLYLLNPVRAQTVLTRSSGRPDRRKHPVKTAVRLGQAAAAAFV